MRPPKGVRPTTAKVLEALMAILEPELEGARVLDLFAGTGALGLAAWQRGASQVTFVEAATGVARSLRQRLPQGCQLIQGSLPEALERLQGSFEVILADPPYGDPAGPASLARLGPLVGGVAVFEHHHKDPYPDQAGELTLEQRRRYGETALSFYRRTS